MDFRFSGYDDFTIHIHVSICFMKIVKYPDEFLRKESRPVEEVGEEERKLMDDMLKTMYESNGIGLAAVQVGHHKRIAVVDTSASKSNPIFLVNPVLVQQSDLTLTGEEGCLSAPGKFAKVPRQTRIKIEYMCYHGKRLCKTFYDLAAIVIQHEIDHMNGKLCIDHE